MVYFCITKIQIFKVIKEDRMHRYFGMMGSFFGVLSVIIGAIGAHALTPLLDDAQLASFETGAKYQMYHALLLLLLVVIPIQKQRLQHVIFWLLVAGIILFSWSIFLLSTNHLTRINFKPIALLTPLGGFLLIFAWLVLFYTFLKQKIN